MPGCPRPDAALAARRRAARARALPASVALAAAALAACLAASLSAAAAAGDAPPRLRLATTTSTENSGLLQHLLPEFEGMCACRVLVMAVGTGKALRIAEAGDADLVLVHSPEAEKAFVAAGHGVGRRRVMHNDFVLAGPPGDPAGVAGQGDIVRALGAIARARAPFVSRGDDSGTHSKELSLWALLDAEAGTENRRDREWYLETGVGMANALLVADQKRAYILSDRGTFLFLSDRVDLAIMADGADDARLHNPYSVIAVNPERHPHTDHALASEFVRWLVSSGTARRINSYKVRGEQLFFAE